MDEHERRVRERAYRLWQEEGCPEGRAEAHWDMARELVAQEENQSLTTKPVAEGTAQPPGAEPVEIPEMVEKQADVPNLTDQGDKPAYPKRAVAARRRSQSKR
jgi:hypothetical protein